MHAYILYIPGFATLSTGGCSTSARRLFASFSAIRSSYSRHLGRNLLLSILLLFVILVCMYICAYMYAVHYTILYHIQYRHPDPLLVPSPKPIFPAGQSWALKILSPQPT
jgi:hypothetical protein